MSKRRRYNKFIEPDYDRHEVSHQTHQKWINSVQAATEKIAPMVEEVDATTGNQLTISDLPYANETDVSNNSSESYFSSSYEDNDNNLQRSFGKSHSQIHKVEESKKRNNNFYEILIFGYYIVIICLFIKIRN
ncbi:PREDICTED: uncharacterized protein LOC105460156 [Wasmannia auropunctata]|uniref:uncharacterized protein LOC105460156 n=1 Tax=Wasmannia auropunctata TaxID=64793 RepID=UPI0005F07D3D|nr:PREDICTED: uncharacterized protein LOC105460156 [Wasmannia auropunctata]